MFNTKPHLIKGLSLVFNSKSEEELYLQSIKAYHSDSLKLLLFVCAIISSYYHLVGQIAKGIALLESFLVLAGSLGVLGCIYFLIKRNKITKLEHLLCLIMAGIVISICESNKQFWNGQVFYSVGNCIQLLSCFLMITRVRFKINFAFVIFSQLYPLWRLGTLKDMINTDFYALGMNLLILFWILGFEYFVEKNARLSFYQTLEYQKNLENFRNLFNKIIPMALMVIKNKEVIFCNSYCKSLLKFSDESFAKEELKHIFLETEHQDKGSENLPTDYLLLGGEDGLLLGLIDVMEQNNDSDGKFLNLSGYLKNETEISIRNVDIDNRVPLDIQMGCVTWENDKAIMIILSDGSAKKRIQTLKELDKYKDRLLATVSHDLRTPLNGIIGMNEAALELCTSKEVKKLLSLSKKSANLLNFMINDILDFSQIIERKLRMCLKTVEIVSCIKELIKIVRFQAKFKGLELIFENKLNKNQLEVTTDPNRVKQILLNLIGNSIKFTREGFVKISVEITNIFGSAALLITVSDSGIGIKKENLPHLFKMFGKLEQFDKNINSTGIGLGLAISQNLVELLSSHRRGGVISVKSEVGVGSHFNFPIFLDNIGNISDDDFKEGEVSLGSDLEEGAPPEVERLVKSINIKKIKGEGKAQHAQFPSLANNGKPNVLIVDDDYINRLVVSKYMQSFRQYNHATANNGQEALSIINRLKSEKIYVDILFIDCNMPIMDGFECVRNIRKMIGAGDIPELAIVALTGSSSEEDVKRCYASGMNHFLKKPLNKTELDEILLKVDKKCN